MAEQFQITLRPVAELAPYAKNARTHSLEQIEQIKGLIRLVGFTNPVLVDEAGIIAGHGRQIAVSEMHEAGEPVMGPGKRFAIPPGMIPVIDGTGMGATERRAYIIADNAVALNSDWDRALLSGELLALKALDFNLEAIGFDPSALIQFMAGPASDRDPEEVPDQPPPVSQAGDVWQLGEHRLICGDSTDAATVAALLGDERPHLMVTDPPYGVNYDPEWRERAGDLGRWARAVGKVENDDRADWGAAWALFPGDVAYVWHAGNMAHTVADSLIVNGLEIRAQIIWNKSNMVISRGDYQPKHEPCWYAVRKGRRGHYVGGRKQTTVWDIDKPQKSETGHSTQKPVECMKRPVENNSKAGDAVYEPFSGSGTTIIACEMTQRRCFGIELSPAYVDLAVVRWQNFTGREAFREADGRSFAELAGL